MCKHTAKVVKLVEHNDSMSRGPLGPGDKLGIEITCEHGNVQRIIALVLDTGLYSKDEIALIHAREALDSQDAVAEPVTLVTTPANA